MIDTTGTGATSTSTVSSVYADAQGISRIIVEVSDTQVWQVATADAFVWAAPVCITYNLRYPGQYFDAETRLTYNGQRYHDATSNDYLQADLQPGLARG